VNPLTVELALESWEKRVCNPIDAQQIAADAYPTPPDLNW